MFLVVLVIIVIQNHQNLQGHLKTKACKHHTMEEGCADTMGDGDVMDANDARDWSDIDALDCRVLRGLRSKGAGDSLLDLISGSRCLLCVTLIITD